jgi:ABC-type cobalamin transport system ATPase subunit
MKDGKILAGGSREEILRSEVLNTAYGINVADHMRKQLVPWEG